MRVYFKDVKMNKKEVDPTTAALEEEKSNILEGEALK